MDPFNQEPVVSHRKRSVIITGTVVAVISIIALGIAYFSDTTVVVSGNVRCTDADVDVFAPDINYATLDRVCISRDSAVDSNNIIRAYLADNLRAIHGASVNISERIPEELRISSANYGRISFFTKPNALTQVSDQRIDDVFSYLGNGDQNEVIFDGLSLVSESNFADSNLYEYQIKYNANSDNAPFGTYPLYVSFVYLEYTDGERYFMDATASSFEIPLR